MRRVTHMRGFLCAMSNLMDILYCNNKLRVLDIFKRKVSLVSGNFSTSKVDQLEQLQQGMFISVPE